MPSPGAAVRFEIVVDEGLAGKTVAALVREGASRAGHVALPWSKARQLVERGKVTVDGEAAVSSSSRLGLGSRVVVDDAAPRRRKGTLDPERIRFCDRDVVVVDKPHGLLSVPFRAGDKDTLLDLTAAALRKGSQPQRSPLGVVQRLDKDTTGLLVFSRNLPAKRALSSQLREHSVTRSYLAVVHGTIEAKRIETHLIRDRGDGLRGSFGAFRRPTHRRPKDAQRAVTHVRPVASAAGVTLVRCRLETGRQHQIRIHLSEAGHPLVGEPVYIRDFEGPVLPASRPLLHAETLGFDHPRSAERITLRQEPPEDFRRWVAEHAPALLEALRAETAPA